MPLEVTINAQTTASLADYTRPALIVPRLRERDTAGIISELSQVLQREGCVPDVLPFYQAALNQELLANSALDCGLAFPARALSGVKRLQFAFGPHAGADHLGRQEFLAGAIGLPAGGSRDRCRLLSALAGQPRPAGPTARTCWPSFARRRMPKPSWPCSGKSGCARDDEKVRSPKSEVRRDSEVRSRMSDCGFRILRRFGLGDLF